MNNVDLFRGLQAGYGTPQYEAAARYIISHFAPMVMGYVMQNNGNEEDGDDIFQITFMAMLDNIEEGRYDETDNFGGLFMRITHNKWLDELARRKRINTGQLPFDAADSNDEDDFGTKNDVSEEEDRDVFIKDKKSKGKNRGKLLPMDKVLQLWEKWDKLNEKTLFKLFYIDGLDSKEIAEKYGVEDNAMRQQLRRARIAFREYVEKNIK